MSGEGFAQQRRFIAIARRRNKRRDHIAIAIAEGDDLVAFHLLVTAETSVVAAFLRRGRCTVAVDHGGIEEIGLMQLQHRACKDGLKTAIRLPPSKGAINARVMNFWAAFLIFFDRQFLPLTPQVRGGRESQIPLITRDLRDLRFSRESQCSGPIGAGAEVN